MAEPFRPNPIQPEIDAVYHHDSHNVVVSLSLVGMTRLGGMAVKFFDRSFHDLDPLRQYFLAVQLQMILRKRAYTGQYPEIEPSDAELLASQDAKEAFPELIDEKTHVWLVVSDDARAEPIIDSSGSWSFPDSVLTHHFELEPGVVDFGEFISEINAREED